jgi:hypothetical protein
LNDDNRYKKAVLDNGRTVRVPPFLVAGDVIVVNLPDETYLGKSDGSALADDDDMEGDDDDEDDDEDDDDDEDSDDDDEDDDDEEEEEDAKKK